MVATDACDLLLGRPCKFDRHVMHLRAVFDQLREDSLFVNKKKCSFFSTSAVFLGYVVPTNGVHAD